jgi:hypothetical protein
VNETPITLEFLGHQLRRLLAERETDRADLLTMMAVIQRVEGAIASLQTGNASLQTQVGSLGVRLTTMHAYNPSLGERMSKIDDTLIQNLRTSPQSGIPVIATYRSAI